MVIVKRMTYREQWPKHIVWYELHERLCDLKQSRQELGLCVRHRAENLEAVMEERSGILCHDRRLERANQLHRGKGGIQCTSRRALSQRRRTSLRSARYPAVLWCTMCANSHLRMNSMSGTKTLARHTTYGAALSRSRESLHDYRQRTRSSSRTKKAQSRERVCRTDQRGARQPQRAAGASGRG